MLPDRVNLKPFDRLEPGRHPRRPQIASVNGFVSGLIELIAIALGPFTSDTNSELVPNNWHVEHAFKAAVVVVSDIDGGHGFPLIGRLC